jgi:hypothetical protein
VAYCSPKTSVAASAGLSVSFRCLWSTERSGYGYGPFPHVNAQIHGPSRYISCGTRGGLHPGIHSQLDHPAAAGPRRTALATAHPGTGHLPRRPSATSPACSATASAYRYAACVTAARLIPSDSRSTPPPATATKTPSCAPDSPLAPRKKPPTPPAPSTSPDPATNQAHDPGHTPEELTAPTTKLCERASAAQRGEGLKRQATLPTGEVFKKCPGCCARFDRQFAVQHVGTVPVLANYQLRLLERRVPTHEQLMTRFAARIGGHQLPSYLNRCVELAV